MKILSFVGHCSFCILPFTAFNGCVLFNQEAVLLKRWHHSLCGVVACAGRWPLSSPVVPPRSPRFSLLTPPRVHKATLHIIMPPFSGLPCLLWISHEQGLHHASVFDFCWVSKLSQPSTFNFLDKVWLCV